MASLSQNPSKKSLRTSSGDGSSQGSRKDSGATVKFARRTSSGRYVSLSKEDLDMSGEISGDYMNYTVHIPPTPDNQPMDSSVAASKAEEQYVSNSLFTGGFNSVTRAHLMDKVIESEVTHPQMAGSKGSSCSVPNCDGKVMKDARGADVIPCGCRYVCVCLFKNKLLRTINKFFFVANDYLIDQVNQKPLTFSKLDSNGNCEDGRYI